MDLYYVGLCFISVLGVALGGVDLQVDNAEPKVGETATFTCIVTDMTPLDYMRFVRRIADVDYEISTNAYMADPFKSSGRYGVTENAATFILTITAVEGQDSGDIGCVLQKKPTPESKYLNFNVKVPPKSVEILQHKGGDYVALSAGDTVELEQGKPGGFACVVTMEDTDVKPDLKITYGNMQLSQDTEGVEFPDSTPTVTSGEGYQKISQEVRGHYTTTAQSMDSGKTVTCTASTDGFDDVKATATVSVLYKPAFTCDTSKTVRAGKPDYSLSCTAVINPPATESSWSWQADGADAQLKTGENNDEFTASQKELGDGKYEFTLTFSTTDAEDFRDYTLTVTNPVGTSQQVFTLEERRETTASPVEEFAITVEATTAEPTTSTKKAENNNAGKPVNAGPTYKTNVGDGGNGGATVSFSSLLLVAIVTKFISDRL